MQVVSVDIMHPPMDLENTSPLDLETDHPPLDNETDPLYLETDTSSLETDPPPLDHPCPEADHSPVLSDLHADQPHCQDFQTSHPPAQGFLANYPSIGLRFTEDVKMESLSLLPR